MSAPLFPLGQVVATPGALDAARYPGQLLELLARHVRGDWGHIDPEDFEINRIAVADGDRILSAYPINPERPCAGYGENCLWVITEADRSVTTILRRRNTDGKRPDVLPGRIRSHDEVH